MKKARTLEEYEKEVYSKMSDEKRLKYMYELSKKDCEYEKKWNELKEWMIKTFYLYMPFIYQNSSYSKILEKMEELEKNG